MEDTKYSTIDEELAATLVELILDDRAQDETKIRALNKLLEGQESKDFFDTLLEEDLSKGQCPYCQHENHWLIPEDELNQRGIVTHERDHRVLKNTTKFNCPEFEEACAKKKVVA